MTGGTGRGFWGSGTGLRLANRSKYVANSYGSPPPNAHKRRGCDARVNAACNVIVTFMRFVVDRSAVACYCICGTIVLYAVYIIRVGYM
jgi:hypothetical protein